MKKRLIELGKNILIVLLLCSAILLAIAALPPRSLKEVPWITRVLQPMAPLLGLPEAELTHVEEATPVFDAAQPIAISVMGPSGRSTAMWDFAELDDAFERFSPILGQAMEDAGNFAQVSTPQVQAALSESSVYFRYSSALPADLLASWLDAKLGAAIGATDTCILSASEDTLSLYLLGEKRYCAKTQIPSDVLLPLLERSEPDGSRFCFESDFPLAPLSLLPGTEPAVPAVTASNPCEGDYLITLATELGFNPYGEGRYTDDSGTVLFSETNASVTISPEGLVTFTSTGEHFVADSLQPEALAETARQLTHTVIESVPGEGRLYLSALEREGDVTVCRFDYLISGIPVQTSRAAAAVTFTGQRVTQAVVQVYSFTGTGRTIYPLPTTQAAALLPEGSKLEMAYFINADQTLSAGWIR
ncbi:MAG: hypothetical protein J6J43_06695 [Oscillospiraceae bacterium]|nr:hypothetical protein [Oscillospiraceae bacterium]